jgi:hypothetical protein
VSAASSYPVRYNEWSLRYRQRGQAVETGAELLAYEYGVDSLPT